MYLQSLNLKLSLFFLLFQKLFRFLQILLISICYGLFVPIQASAIYDEIAIDVSMIDNTVSFALTPDYKQDTVVRNSPDIKLFENLYVVAQLGNNDIFFFNKNEGTLGIEPFIPGVEPTAFIAKACCNEEELSALSQEPCTPTAFIAKACYNEKITLGSFDVTSLSGIKLFAGSGSSLADLLNTGKIVQFYDGQLPVLPQPTRQWTVMIYMVGSDLEGDILSKKRYASKNIMQMIAGTTGLADNTLNTVLCTGGSKRRGWQSVKRTFVHKGNLYPMADMGDVNMAKAQTLSDFVNWSKESFPASHYALILWSHGHGTQGFADDANHSENGSRMYFSEMDQAFKNIKKTMDRPLDIILYDACLMATIEVAQITSQAAQVMGASADTEPGFGMDYQILLSELEQKNIDNGIDFGKNALNAYIQNCKNNGKFEGGKSAITYSIFNLDELGPFNVFFDFFSKKLNNIMGENTWQAYFDMSKGLIRTLSYPVFGRYSMISENWLDRETDHLAVDLIGWLDHLSQVIPDLKDECTPLIDTILGKPLSDGSGFQGGLIVDYDGNIDSLKNIDSRAGRMSIDLGDNNEYICSVEQPDFKYLPEQYGNIKQAMLGYYAKRAMDTSDFKTAAVCEDSNSCAGPNWLKIYDAELLLNLSVWLCQVDSEKQTNNVLSIQSLYNSEPVENNKKFSFPRTSICIYSLCVDGICEWITVTEDDEILTAEAMINDAPSILTFTELDANTCKIENFTQYINETWSRGENVMTGDSIIPIQTSISDNVPHTRTAETAFTVMDISSIHLKRVCEVDIPSVWVSFFGLNRKPQFDEVCSGDSECYMDEQGQDSYPGVKIQN